MADGKVEVVIKAIIFDFGSVIYRTDWKKLERYFRKKYGKSLLIGENEELRRVYFLTDIGKSSMREYFRILLPQVKGNEILEIYKNLYNKSKIIDKKLLLLIKKLKKRYILYGFTDVKKIHFDANNELGLYNNFLKVFASFKIGLLKKDLKAFIIVKNKIKFKPEECLFIDDSKSSIFNARKIGFKTIHYTRFPDYNSLAREMRKKGIDVD